MEWYSGAKTSPGGNEWGANCCVSPLFGGCHIGIAPSIFWGAMACGSPEFIIWRSGECGGLIVGGGIFGGGNGGGRSPWRSPLPIGGNPGVACGGGCCEAAVGSIGIGGECLGMRGDLLRVVLPGCSWDPSLGAKMSPEVCSVAREARPTGCLFLVFPLIWALVYCPLVLSGPS